MKITDYRTLVIKINPAIFEELEEYCRSNQISKSALARQGILKIIRGND